MNDVGSSIWGLGIDSDEVFPRIREADERWAELLDDPEARVRIVLEHFAYDTHPRWYGSITFSHSSFAQFDWLLDTDHVSAFFD